MRTTICYCDKCGERIVDKNLVLSAILDVPSYDPMNKEIVVKQGITMDLCWKCYATFTGVNEVWGHNTKTNVEQHGENMFTLLIDIPYEFEYHYSVDRFHDSFQRILADIHSSAGLYEKELIEMLDKAFTESVIYEG